MTQRDEVALDAPGRSIHDRNVRPDRVSNLTGIRAFAALWVVLYHFRTTEVVSTIGMDRVVSGGYLGVDVFFVLSGFILALNYGPTNPTRRFFDREFTVRRFARIYPLHAVTFVASVAAWAAAVIAGYGFVSDTSNTWWTAAANVLNVHGWAVTDELSWNTPSWSVSSEWFAYIVLFPVLVRVVGPRSIRSGLMATGALWMLFVLYVAHRRGGELSEVTTDGVFRIIPEFTAGFMLYRICHRRAGSGGRSLSGQWGDVLAAVSVVALVAISMAPNPAWVLVLPVVVCLIAGLHEGGRVTDAVFGNRTVLWLGELSYGIYMVHVLVQIAFNLVLRRAQIAPTLSNAVLVLAAEILVTVLVAFVAHRLVEVPARRWIVARFAGRRGESPAGDPVVGVQRPKGERPSPSVVPGGGEGRGDRRSGPIPSVG